MADSNAHFDPHFEVPEDGRADLVCRPPSSPLGCVFVILLALPLPVFLILAIGTGMPPMQAVLVLGALAVFAITVFWTVVRLLWEPFRRRYPAVHPTEATVWRRMQFVRLGFLGGFNGCVNVGSDAAHVHLDLMAPFGWFARPMSIPRSEIEWGDRPRPPGGLGMARVRLTGRRSHLPMWVFR